MISVIVLLFLLALVLFFFEAFLPGGILGLIGLGLMLAGVLVAFLGLGVGSGFIALGVAVVLSAVMFYIEYYVLPRTRIGRRFIHEKVVAGAAITPVDSTVYVGRIGLTLTPLRPSGRVRVEGDDLEAVSISGFLDADRPVRIVSVEGNLVKVSRSEEAAATT